jgi:hypothetical protein
MLCCIRRYTRGVVDDAPHHPHHPKSGNELLMETTSNGTPPFVLTMKQPHWYTVSCSTQHHLGQAHINETIHSSCRSFQILQQTKFASCSPGWVATQAPRAPRARVMRDSTCWSECSLDSLEELYCSTKGSLCRPAPCQCPLIAAAVGSPVGLPAAAGH